MKYIFPVTLLLISGGCSTLHPEEAGYDTYYLESKVPDGCKKLGELEAKASSSMGADAAKSEARSRLFKMATEKYQGNTMYISEIGEYFVSANKTAFAKGVVYDCPK